MMYFHFPMNDLPYAVPSFKVVVVACTDSLRYLVRCCTNTVDVANTTCSVDILERDDEVRRKVTGCKPAVPENVLRRMLNTIVIFESAEGRADLPNRILPPNGTKSIPITFVETVAVVADEIVYRRLAFEAVEAVFDVGSFNHDLARPGLHFS